MPPLAGFHFQQKLCWKRVTSGQQSVGDLPNSWGNNSFHEISLRDHCGNNSHTKCLVIVTEAMQRSYRYKKCSYNSKETHRTDLKASCKCHTTASFFLPLLLPPSFLPSVLSFLSLFFIFLFFLPALSSSFLFPFFYNLSLEIK